MFTLSPAAFLGKEKFDSYLLSLPEEGNDISLYRKIELSQTAYELYSKGLPYSLRPECLYYFYHFYPVNQNEIEEDMQDKLEMLNCSAAQLLNDAQTVKYLELLDSEKYFEVFQIRGIIETRVSGLEDYLNLVPDKEWGEIQQMVLSFIDNEPVCSHYLIEKMLTGLSNYYYNNNLKTSVRYKIAEKVWECSTNTDMLHSAWLCLNNPEDIFEYKKATLPETEVVKLLRLEKLEKEIMNSFDESRISNKNKNLFFKLFSDDFCLTWLRLIDDSIDFFKNDDYVKGYAEFLRGYVCLASGHLKRAQRELNRAFVHKYNPVIVLMYIVSILETLDKYNEAVEYSLQTVKMLGADREDLKKEECLQKVARVLRRTNTKPILANSIVESKSRENEISKKIVISTVYPEHISENRRKNITERIKQGIKLFDGLIDAESLNSLWENPERLDEIFITVPAAEIEFFGLEELEYFIDKTDTSDGCVSTEVTLSALINYNADLIIKSVSQAKFAMKEIIEEFPNSLACIFVVKQVIREITDINKVSYATGIMHYFISCQKDGTIAGLYDLAEPVRKILHSYGRYIDETLFISEIKAYLNSEELERANSCLAEVKEKSEKQKRAVKRRSFLPGNQISFVNSQLVAGDFQTSRKLLLIGGFFIIIAFIILMLFLFIS